MEQICPICNGLHTKSRLCPECGGELEERGALQDFVDDYSPYLDGQLGQSLMGTQECVHLYYCRACSEDVRISTPRWEV